MWVLLLLRLPHTSIYNKLAIWCFNRCRFGECPLDFRGPFEVAYLMTIRYGLADFVNTMMDTGQLLSKTGWKKMCREAVKGVYSVRWRATRVLYPRLSFFNNIVGDAEPAVWWIVCRNAPQYTRHCVNVIRLINGENKLNSNRGRHTLEVRTSTSCLCSMFADETVEHLLNHCPALQTTRERLWQRFTSVAPTGLLESLAIMSEREKTLFLCSAFNSQYVREWQRIYQAAAVFISIMYETRCKLMTE